MFEVAGGRFAPSMSLDATLRAGVPKGVTPMLFTFFLIDKPGALAQRMEIRPEHKAYLGAKAEQIAFAGPLLADDGKTMVGSLLVIDFPAREDAQRWLAGEPFTRAGVYASTAIYPFQNLWPQKAGFPPTA